MLAICELAVDWHAQHMCYRVGDACCAENVTDGESNVNWPVKGISLEYKRSHHSQVRVMAQLLA